VSTYVFFHAHPDDEVLLTGGSMALLAARGHRVVLVTATTGERGLAGESVTRGRRSLGTLRLDELKASADILGCARVVLLGFPDSGSALSPAPGSFATVPVEVAATALAEVLVDERADVVTGYDAAGGYGHPDHVRVHHVARAAARLAGSPLLLEATVDRRALRRALRIAAPFARGAPDFRARRFADLYTAHDSITHRIDVRGLAAQKRAAMRAHLSQTTGGDGLRSVARFVNLPPPIFRAVFGWEWYVSVQNSSRRRPLRHLPFADN
jgi:LmbE family N-acetylglucosaminyl deacetylase